jgi:hypothetical protein
MFGLLAQLVEQRTFNPRAQAPAQGFLTRFAVDRSPRGPRKAIERRFRHTVCHSRAPAPLATQLRQSVSTSCAVSTPTTFG